MSGLDDRTVAALARELYAAERDAAPIEQLTARHPGMTLVDAYAVQLAGRDLRVRDGARLVGRKVGLTSAAMQRLLGVGEPDFGYLAAAMVLPDGARLARTDLIAPRAEAEIAFRLGEPLSGPDVDLASAIAAIGAIAPSLEVVDSRIADWRIALADTIADNASSGLAVIGAFQPLDDVDLAEVEMTMTVEGPARTEREHGRGEAVLGHPAAALAWLARALAPYGEGIAAGEVVIPGAMASAVSIDAGDVVRADFGKLGEIVLHVDEGTNP